MNSQWAISSATFRLSKVLMGIGFGVVLMMSAGCSVKGNIEDLTKKTIVSSAALQTGLISGSQQNAVVNGYKVSSSLGDYSTGIQQTVNGYTVYGSVQGNMDSTAQ